MRRALSAWRDDACRHPVIRQAVRVSAVAPLRACVTTIDELNCDLGAATTIVLADDHAVVRSALRMLLDAKAGLEVVGEASDVAESLHKVRDYKPNVLVLDLSVPGGSSLAAIPALREASPDTAIVVLTMQDEPACARAALRAGALGFALKEAADSEPIEAVHAAVRGHRCTSTRNSARGSRSRSGRRQVDPRPRNAVLESNLKFRAFRRFCRRFGADVDGGVVRG
jgi:DNA-binding NarL/FixJ family response regulator